ncbi:MAG: hypothetical protein ACYC3I_26990 [Gemmataceae bacterium]
MARNCKRTRLGRASIETLRAEFQAKRNNAAAFALLLQRLAESDLPLWSVAKCATGDKPLDDEERAMLAQLTAPHLAWKSPGSVFLRHVLAK